MRKRARNIRTLSLSIYLNLLHTHTHTHNTFSYPTPHRDANHINPHHMWLQQQIITLTSSTSFEGRSLSHTHARVHTLFCLCMMVFCCVARELVTRSPLPPPSSDTGTFKVSFRAFFNQGKQEVLSISSYVFVYVCVCTTYVSAEIECVFERCTHIHVYIYTCRQSCVLTKWVNRREKKGTKPSLKLVWERFLSAVRN